VALLEVENLSVEYRSSSGSVRALTKVSFTLDEAEVLGVVGESGSGKSTLALALSGLLDHSATLRADKIVFMGIDLLSNIESVRGTGVFMVFQDPFSSLNPLMKIKHQIFEAIKVRCKRLGESFSQEEAKKEALELLKEVRIADPEDVLERYPHQLSGGQQQRVMIAMALAERPKLLIADEPTTALDVITQAQVLSIFKEVVKRRRMSMIFITHDLAVASQICDRIIVLYGGMIQEVGLAEEVLKDPKHPYTMGLIGSIPYKSKEEGALTSIKGFFSHGVEGCVFSPRCAFAREECKKGVPKLNRVNGRLVRCINYGKDYE